jgi:hypothetical protein
MRMARGGGILWKLRRRTGKCGMCGLASWAFWHSLRLSVQIRARGAVTVARKWKNGISAAMRECFFPLGAPGSFAQTFARLVRE